MLALAGFGPSAGSGGRFQIPVLIARAKHYWRGGLGLALFRLGELECGTARLEEAVSAYREASQERTRERVPLQWAGSTGNQGVAMMLLAEWCGDTKMAKLAVQQIEAAFTASRDGGDAYSAAMFEAHCQRPARLPTSSPSAEELKHFVILHLTDPKAGC